MKDTVGKHFNLNANKFSSMRTKMRIVEHGEKFEVLRVSNNCNSFDGRPAILFRSEKKNVKDGLGNVIEWVGWFPIDEIEMIENNQ